MGAVDKPPHRSPSGDNSRQNLQTAAVHSTLNSAFEIRPARFPDDLETVRTLFRIEVRSARSDPRIVEVVVEGTGFLHRMVRIIVGSLVDVGRKKLTPSTLEAALTSGDRTTLGITAPPDGLHLDEIVLDDDGRDGWPPEDRAKSPAPI